MKGSQGTWPGALKTSSMKFIAGKRGHRRSGDGGGSSDDDAIVRRGSSSRAVG
jgi:hypothetical protein